MNGRIAKQLKKRAYGDNSRRLRSYGVKKPIGKLKAGNHDQLYCTGLRAEYKQFKKEYKEGRGR